LAWGRALDNPVPSGVPQAQYRAVVRFDPVDLNREDAMAKPPPKRLSDLKPAAPPPGAYAKASPKMARMKPGKVLTAAEKAAFLASRPDLKPKA